MSKEIPNVTETLRSRRRAKNIDQMASWVFGTVVDVVGDDVSMTEEWSGVDEHSLRRFPASLSLFYFVGLIVDLTQDGGTN